MQYIDFFLNIRLRDQIATCPNCRVEISKSTASRNLAVEKAASELPSECQVSWIFSNCKLKLYISIIKTNYFFSFVTRSSRTNHWIDMNNTNALNVLQIVNTHVLDVNGVGRIMKVSNFILCNKILLSKNSYWDLY